MGLLRIILKGEVISIYLFAFLIPLNPKWYGFGLILIVLESIIKYKKIEKLQINSLISLKNPFIWLVFFYLFHVIGLTNTENFQFANMDLGMKSTFIIFPVYFLLFRPKVNLQKLFKTFVWGCMFSLALYTIVLVFQYVKNDSILTGSDFSFWMHRGYYATYLLIAFTYIYRETIRTNKLKVTNVIILISLFSGTLISESKAGILIILINSFILTFYFFKIKLGWIKSTFFMVLLSLIAVFSLSKILEENNRFSGALYNFNKENIDVTSLESTTARILMWETSIDLITDNIFTGVGTGDIKEELQSLNYEKGYTGVAEANLNAHNQFLNSWTALGLFGFIALISVFLTLLISGDPKNIFFIRLLSLSFFLVFLTESFLEVQAGIIPFAFFISCIGQSKAANREVETVNHD